MIQIDYFIDSETGEEHKYIVSDVRFKTLCLTKEGEDEPSRFAIRLTEDMEDCITQGWEA